MAHGHGNHGLWSCRSWLQLMAIMALANGMAHLFSYFFPYSFSFFYYYYSQLLLIALAQLFGSAFALARLSRLSTRSRFCSALLARHSLSRSVSWPRTCSLFLALTLILLPFTLILLALTLILLALALGSLVNGLFSLSFVSSRACLSRTSRPFVYL